MQLAHLLLLCRRLSCSLFRAIRTRASRSSLVCVFCAHEHMTCWVIGHIRVQFT